MEDVKAGHAGESQLLPSSEALAQCQSASCRQHMKCGTADKGVAPFTKGQARQRSLRESMFELKHETLTGQETELSRLSSSIPQAWFWKNLSSPRASCYLSRERERVGERKRESYFPGEGGQAWQ